MPNWVTNNLRVSNIEKFREFAISIENDKEIINFNKLIPMPADLDGQWDWSEQDKFGFGGERLQKKLDFQKNKFKEFLSTYYNERITQKKFIKIVRQELSKNKELLTEFQEVYEIEDIYEEPKEIRLLGLVNAPFEQVIGGYFNYTRYGSIDWYNWRLDHWGTKWNASEMYMSGDAITFSTAWTCPWAWLQELAKHVDFNFSYADEDIGCNLGIGFAKDGQITFENLEETVPDYLDRRYLALTIRGEDYEDFLYMMNDDDEEKVRQDDILTEKKEELKNKIADFV